MYYTAIFLYKTRKEKTPGMHCHMHELGAFDRFEAVESVRH